MKLTLNWLKEFVDFRDAPEKLAETLTMAGLEVESLVPARAPDGSEDWIFELGVTPNRGDCLGVIGIAREIAALKAGRPKPQARKAAAQKAAAPAPVKVEIQSPRACQRYSAQAVKAIRLGPSPDWLRFRLEAAGIRAINNVVDITNYVMVETGQPLHAFDLDRLAAKRIVVRQAKEIATFVTLDDVERRLAPEDLLICDGDVPVALAGVMGGRDSEVHQGTTAVLLESARFDPATIRRTAKRLGLHSEASHRFERGVDPEGTVAALERAAALLQEIAGGIPLGGVIDRYPRPPAPPTIALRPARVAELIGVDIKPAEIEKNLKALGCKVQTTKAAFKVTPPSYRGDLTREADLIEELARLHGYDKIPSTLPGARLAGKPDARLGAERGVRSYLVGEGLVEAIHLPFSSAETNRSLPGLLAGEKPVAIQNPLVQESAEMRLSLVPGLIEDLKVNLAQRAEGFGAFALNKVFYLDAKGEPAERHHLAGLLYGRRFRSGLRAEEAPFGFLDAKGLVEGLLDGRGAEWSWSASDLPAFLHPGRAARLSAGNVDLGYIGEIHPDLAEEMSIGRCLTFELDFEKLLQYVSPKLTVRSLPRFPSVERDLAMIVDESFPAQRIIDWIKDLRNALIEKVEVFDQYRGASIPEGKKSLAYSISYRAEDRTLTDAEVQALHGELVTRLGEVFGAQLRG
ncbi:MAG TPA: phenylalanine--tRNA ligase subunit beta [Candidatus Binatia bacterium]|nr:phenylalanine--tRNA ligase subunit beta [Candidatus Binatia bacterium]